MEPKFNLLDYVDTVRNLAKEQDNMVSLEQAIGMFIVNLNTFSDYYKGTENLNIRTLGQAWGRLSSEEKNTQRVALLMKLVPTNSKER